MKRVCDLKPGDRFYLNGIERIYVRASRWNIYYRTWDELKNAFWGKLQTLRLGSQMWVQTYPQKVGKVRVAFIGESRKFVSLINQ